MPTTSPPAQKPRPFGMVDEDDPHIGIVAPFEQRARHVAHHLPVEAVQRLGTVEAQAPREALLLGDDVPGGGHRVHQGIIA